MKKGILDVQSFVVLYFTDPDIGVKILQKKSADFLKEFCDRKRTFFASVTDKMDN